MTEVIISKIVEPEVVPAKESYFSEWLKKQQSYGQVLFGKLEKRGSKSHFIFWTQLPSPFVISISKLDSVKIHGVDCICYVQQEAA
jgi:hypothetical protein